MLISRRSRPRSEIHINAAAPSGLPTFFLSHGAGPWPWMGDNVFGLDHSHLRASIEQIPQEVGTTPAAVLVISGHWEADEFTVQTNPRPPMLYDYGGFPEFTYRIRYPAPGSPAVAARVTALLGEAGVPVEADPDRGYSHGTFAPMHVAWPAAAVPVLELSIKSSYDVGEHLAVGRALAPLRHEGVLIIGSGSSFHNLRPIDPRLAARTARQWDDWLTAAVTGAPEQRSALLQQWRRAPGAGLAHPREDHLLPLMVAAAAAETEPAYRTYHEDSFGGVAVSGYRFGGPHAVPLDYAPQWTRIAAERSERARTRHR